MIDCICAFMKAFVLPEPRSKTQRHQRQKRLPTHQIRWALTNRFLRGESPRQSVLWPKIQHWPWIKSDMCWRTAAPNVTEFGIAQFCHDHAHCAHPLWCFRKDHGGEWGFACGGDPDDDLPTRMHLPCSRVAHAICRVLSKSHMETSVLDATLDACCLVGHNLGKQKIFLST